MVCQTEDLSSEIFSQTVPDKSTFKKKIHNMHTTILINTF